MEKIGIIFILLGVIVICELAFTLIFYFIGTKRYQLQNVLLEQYNEQQKEYFTKQLEIEVETRQFRHDIIGHLIVIRELAEKTQSTELKEYIATLLRDINQINQMQYDVGNDVINTIINYYFLPLKGECRIDVQGYAGEVNTISQTDLCVLISNLAKNASEAVCHMPKEKKEIGFFINRGEKYLNIRMENTMQGSISLNQEGLPETSKQDKENHGMGLQNVKKLMEKYEGKYEGTVENGRYCAEIYVKI